MNFTDMRRLFRGRKYRSGVRWCLLRWTDVDPVGKGDVYLTRLHIVQTPWFSIMLHWLRRPDPQPDLHDHPNDFISIVIRGGYTELRDGPLGHRNKVKITFLNTIRAEDRHKIVEVERNTTTLVFANAVRREWGFWRDDEFISWRKYNFLDYDI